MQRLPIVVLALMMLAPPALAGTFPTAIPPAPDASAFEIARESVSAGLTMGAIGAHTALAGRAALTFAEEATRPSTPPSEVLRTSAALLTSTQEAYGLDATSTIETTLLTADIVERLELHGDTHDARLATVVEVLKLASGPNAATIAIPHHTSARAAFDELLAQHGRGPLSDDDVRASGIALLDEKQNAALARIVDAHLAQQAAAELAIATGDAAPMLALRSEIVEAARAAALVLKPLEAPHLVPLEQCEIFLLDLALWSNSHNCPTALSIDLGGNDVYRNNAGGTHWYSGYPGPERAALAIDFAGNDRYNGAFLDPGHAWSVNGASRDGFGALIDLGGSDVYDASGASGPGASANGASEAGVGLLVDAGGDDDYLGDPSEHLTALNGGGSNSAIFDLGGWDEYLARGGAEVQLGASRAGYSMLVDLDGRDTYDCRRSVAAIFSTKCLGTAASILSAGSLVFDGGMTTGDRYLLDDKSMGVGYANRFAAAIDVSGGSRYELGFLGGGTGYFGFGSIGPAPIPSTPFGIVIAGPANDLFIGNGTGLTMGAGFIGVGVLLDQGGSNVYMANSTHYLNAVQGVAMGGGTGLLIDGGSSPRVELNGPGWGQGGSENVGVGMVVHTGSGTAVYSATDPFAKPLYVSGAGLGMRVDASRVEILGTQPVFTCPFDSRQIARVTPLFVGGDARVCSTSPNYETQWIRNPLTNGYVIVPKPAVPCTSIAFCDSVTDLVLGPDASTWLESGSMYASTSGGLKSISASNLLRQRYVIQSVDDACKLTCGVVARVPAVG